MHFNLGIAVDINSLLIPKIQNSSIGGGSVVFISSDSAKNGRAAPAYVASKAALNAYMKSCARYYAKDNIVFFSVLPGIVYFKNSAWDKKKQTDPNTFNQKLQNSIFKEFATPNHIANFVLSMLNSNNKFINGGEFIINGGE
ncbi:TPA: SDR family oxidoreductase [Campylobacter fetus]|nr:SDR family oxidoreductase [Campylobacter fetus]